MAVEIRHFTVQTPAGTVIATPQIAAMTMPARIVRHIRVRIPPGPRGLLGFSIGMVGTPVIPTNIGEWIVGEDEIMDWDVDDQPSSGAWQLITYNLGLLPHRLYVQFNLDLPGQNSGPTLVAPVAITA